MMKRFFPLIWLVLLPTGAFARDPKPLAGSSASQQRQNRIADRYDLTRLRRREDLERFIKAGLLVRIDDSAAYDLDKDIGSMDPGHADLYRYARPWVKRFLDETLSEGLRETDQRFKITSLVRTEAYQRRLSRRNGNAIHGRIWWKQSSHLTGSTVDISYKDLHPKTVEWLARSLRLLERRGRVEATEERGDQACFHVMVFPQKTRR